MGISTVFKYLLCAYLVSSYKSLPGAYFVRFYSKALYSLIIVPFFEGKSTKNIKRLQSERYGALGYTTLSTYASPFEIDFFFHKSNSTYFVELDISRCELMIKVFQKLFLESKTYPYIPVANVFTNYMKEIKPFQKYNVISNILCWDEKWIYVVSRFTINNNTTICSISITKYVLKDGRKTIKPVDALEFCGIYNDEVAKISAENLKILVEKSGFHETKYIENLKYDYLSI